MKTIAAVAWKSGAPLTIETVDLEGPKAGEVLVEIKATGICHTDYYTLSGADPEGIFPAILGHEGAGIVVDAGPGVTTLQKGDHVIPLYTPGCRQCKFCLSRKTNLCQLIRGTQGKGLMPDATSRFSLDDKPIFHHMGTSTFSNDTVALEISLATIRKDAPFDKLCYIGCGVTTGIGTVTFTAKVEAGAEIRTRPFQLVTCRNWEGSAIGAARSRTDVPKIVGGYMEGKIKIDDLITHTMPLEDIKKGFDLMKRGESIQSVVIY